MSFRIHSHTPFGGTCMINVKGLHRAHSIAAAQLAAKEEEYLSEDESLDVVEEKTQAPQPAQAAAPVQNATNAQMYTPGPTVEETFKLRRKQPATKRA